MAAQYASIPVAAEHFDVAEDFVYSIAMEMNRADRRAFKAGGRWQLDLDDMETFLIARTKEQQRERAARRRELSDPSGTPVNASKIKKSW